MESLKLEMVNLVATRKISLDDYIKVNRQIKSNNVILAIIEYLKLKINK